jgi:benzodiazapine receptor
MNWMRIKGRKNIGLLVLLIAAIQLGGFISGLLAGGSREKYANIIRPDFSPPGWVFPIVWFILYFLMAVAVYRIIQWGSYGKQTDKAIFYFTLQLALNYLWSILFFRFQLYGIAFIELLVLLILIILTTIEFAKIDKWAALLMVPYILWVSFAGILNFLIWLMN